MKNMPANRVMILFIACLFPSIVIAGPDHETILINGFDSPAFKLVFTQAPATLDAGVDPGPEQFLTVQRQNEHGDAGTTGDLSVTVTTSSILGRFALSHLGPFVDKSLVIPMADGEHSRSFYYKDSLIGTATITATSSLPIDGTVQIEIVPGD